MEDVAGAYRAIAGRARQRGGPRRRRSTPAGASRTRSARSSRPICELAGTDVEPDFQGTGNPDGEIDRQYLNSERIRELTGWEPKVGLREGLERTIEWYREHPEARAPAA